MLNVRTPVKIVISSISKVQSTSSKRKVGLELPKSQQVIAGTEDKSVSEKLCKILPYLQYRQSKCSSQGEKCGIYNVEGKVNDHANDRPVAPGEASCEAEEDHGFKYSYLENPVINSCYLPAQIHIATLYTMAGELCVTEPKFYENVVDPPSMCNHRILKIGAFDFNELVKKIGNLVQQLVDKAKQLAGKEPKSEGSDKEKKENTEKKTEGKATEGEKKENTEKKTEEKATEGEKKENTEKKTEEKATEGEKKKI